MKDGGLIELQGKCNICNNLKSSIIKMPKACLPGYLVNEKPGAKYTNAWIDPKTGGIIPFVTWIPMIIAGVSATATAVSDVAIMMIIVMSSRNKI